MAFFFSSRRRHTRSTRDWSSDVCSSDLFRCAERFGDKPDVVFDFARDFLRFGYTRSEERRVGKECRSRWSREPSEKKINALNISIRITATVLASKKIPANCQLSSRSIDM